MFVENVKGQKYDFGEVAHFNCFIYNFHHFKYYGGGYPDSYQDAGKKNKRGLGNLEVS
jgi:hypothetical protein